MPSIFGKSGSTAGRAKTRHKSIRGTISAPIPIPTSPVDDEFPIRNPGSAKASTAADDEFPMRLPGTGIATPLPTIDGPGSAPEEPLEQPEAHAPEDQHDQQPPELESSPDSAIDREHDHGTTQVFAPTGEPASVRAGSGSSRTDLARDSRPEPPSTPPPAPPSGPSTPAVRPVSRPASRSPPQGPSARKTSPLSVSPARASPPARRATNPVLSTIRYSMISDAPTKQTTQSRDSPQRKKSTLRSALGRLFGRGKKKNAPGNQDASGESGRESRPLGSVQHRSDPSALSRPNQRSPKRSASLPISEFDRPLRSHSIGPDDIMAIESARNSLQADPAGPGSSTGIRRRAATTGGHTLLRPHLFNREWGAGLSPRPASAQGRASRADGRADPNDPSEIGRAITSDSGSGLRRRSRSLSGLQDLAGVQRGGRRRSDEIRYWRESYNPGFMSPMSSNAQDDVDDIGMVDTSAPESPAVERPPKTPPQPFNFGLLSKEMIGMKITHAADMDTRLGNLESRTLQLERVVDKLCHTVPGVRGPKDMAQPSSARRSLETDAHSQASLGDYPAYPASLRAPSSSTLKTKTPTTTTATPLVSNQPTSGSTVRGAASLPTLSRGGGAGSTTAPPQDAETATIARLRTDLDAERAARLALEAQVKKLSERVNTLSTTMFAMVRGPSESRSQERLATVAAAAATTTTTTSGGSSPLVPLPPRSTLRVPGPLPPPLLPREQLSVFETDDEDEDGDGDGEGAAAADVQVAKKQGLSAPPSKTGLEEEAGDITEDDFQTPREEQTPMVGYGAFGEELRPDEDDVDDGGGDGENEGGDDDDPKRKKAARTLSLSQLTLGKGVRTRI